MLTAEHLAIANRRLSGMKDSPEKKDIQDVLRLATQYVSHPDQEYILGMAMFLIFEADDTTNDEAQTALLDYCQSPKVRRRIERRTDGRTG